ncbi:MAG TPA: hypothetical protein VF059_00020, partial [Casimicrobiaceae bacterium]
MRRTQAPQGSSAPANASGGAPALSADARLRARGIGLRWKLALAVAIVFAVVAAIDAAEVVVLWSRIPAELRAPLAQSLDDAAGLVVLFAAFLLVALGMLVAAWFRTYVERMAQLGEGARIILTANPAHRIADEGAAEAVELARLINALADRHQGALAAIEQRVRDANATLELEKHRLAALMSDLSSSVLVCNPEGLILLYNEAARSLFDRPADTPPTSGIVGLG